MKTEGDTMDIVARPHKEKINKFYNIYKFVNRQADIL